MNGFRRVSRVAGGMLLLALILFFALAPALIDRRMNRVAGTTGSISDSLANFHRKFQIVDLHADALLWARPLHTRQSRGHLDLPRLSDAGVVLQVFSVVTQVPAGMNYLRNDDRTDLIRWLAIAEAWPPHTWFRLKHRALYQAAKIQRLAERSNSGFFLIRTAGDLDVFLRTRPAFPGRVAGLLAMEGLHPIEEDIANLPVLFEAGFRVFGLTHFFDNAVAGSAHGVAQGGLTALGVEAVDWLERNGGIVDLAHASPAAFDEVIDRVQRPVMVSHTGVQGTCPGPRNLSDAQLDRLKANGGLVGIGFWDGAVCDLSPAAIARAIRYSVDRMGIEHVAFGSDFDGATTVPFDVSGMPHLTGALRDAGFTEQEIERIAGGNALRFLHDALPAE
jgi:microsomal dipeptidase-like Zn-dependent dipeptidase